MRAYYINLALRRDRRTFMEKQIEDLGLAARRIEAVTPAEIPDAARQGSCNPRHYYWMREPELACSWSHLKALRTFIDDGGDAALILEDDVFLSKRLPIFLQEYERTEPIAGLIRVETFLDGQRLSPRGVRSIAGVRLQKSHSWAAGAAAYIVSRPMAELIIGEPWLQHVQIDRALFNPYERLGRKLDVKHCNPGLAIQADRVDGGDMGSDLASVREAYKTPADIAQLRRIWRKLRGTVETEVIIGSQRVFHTVVGGSKKVVIPFDPGS